MTGKLCFWVILSTSDLNFIYVSPSLAKLLGIPPNVVPEMLQDKTLWDLIHPEEYAMARGDLEKFMETKHIGGSVTRCRLVDLDDIIEPKVVRRSSSEIDIPVKIQPRPLDRKKSATGEQNWEVVDIVMYLVTNEIILTFFHADYDLDQPNGAGSLPLICQEIDFTPQDGIDLLAVLRKTPLATAGANNSSGNTRIFQIMETNTSKALVTWPPADDLSRNSLQLADASLSQLLIDCVEKNKHRPVDRLQMHPYEYATCVQQAQVYTQLLYKSGPVKKVEIIVIQYGSITFGSFDISRLDHSTPSLTHTSSSSDSTNISLLSRSVLSSSTSPASIQNDSRNFITLNSIGTNFGARESHLTEQSPDDRDILSTDASTGSLTSTPVWHANIHVNGTSAISNTARVVCESCHTDSSPEWRKGPSGQKTLCNACGLRYARSVAKQDSFGRRQRGVRVVINNEPQLKYPPSPTNVHDVIETPHQVEYYDGETEPGDHGFVHTDPADQQPSNSADSGTLSSRTKRRKKSRYLPIGDNRAGARTRAARKARLVQSDAAPLLTQNPSTL